MLLNASQAGYFNVHRLNSLLFTIETNFSLINDFIWNWNEYNPILNDPVKYLNGKWRILNNSIANLKGTTKIEYEKTLRKKGEIIEKRYTALKF